MTSETFPYRNKMIATFVVASLLWVVVCLFLPWSTSINSGVAMLGGMIVGACSVFYWIDKA